MSFSVMKEDRATSTGLELDWVIKHFSNDGVWFPYIWFMSFDKIIIKFLSCLFVTNGVIFCYFGNFPLVCLCPKTCQAIQTMSNFHLQNRFIGQCVLHSLWSVFVFFFTYIWAVCFSLDQFSSIFLSHVTAESNMQISCSDIQYNYMIVMVIWRSTSSACRTCNSSRSYVRRNCASWKTFVAQSFPAIWCWIH